MQLLLPLAILLSQFVINRDIDEQECQQQIVHK
jgi:hypothetical protein